MKRVLLSFFFLALSSVAASDQPHGEEKTMNMCVMPWVRIVGDHAVELFHSLCDGLKPADCVAKAAALGGTCEAVRQPPAEGTKEFEDWKKRYCVPSVFDMDKCHPNKP
jgi:hypothetical protein